MNQIITPGAVTAYAPEQSRPLSYSALVATYGREAFGKACTEAKNSPLSVQEILEREPARNSEPVTV